MGCACALVTPWTRCEDISFSSEAKSVASSHKLENILVIKQPRWLYYVAMESPECCRVNYQMLLSIQCLGVIVKWEGKVKLELAAMILNSVLQRSHLSVAQTILSWDQTSAQTPTKLTTTEGYPYNLPLVLAVVLYKY